MPPKKRHHYVPIAYLQGFTSEDGCITTFRKADPDNPFRGSPSNTAIEQYYYAFTKEDDSRDTDSFENVFSLLESGWPEITAKLARNESHPQLESDLLEFACVQRARVPATRDAYELMRADATGHVARLLQSKGAFPDAPLGHEDILDRVRISINPEASLEAISIAIKGMSEKLLPKLDFRIAHNHTRIDFITSDNPVCWFVPYKDESRIGPYEVLPNAPLEFLFPLTKRMLLVGISHPGSKRGRHGLIHTSLGNSSVVKRANRLIAKFGYKAIFSTDESPSALVKKYAGVSPVMQTTAFDQTDGKLIMAHMEFAERRVKEKWK